MKKCLIVDFDDTLVKTIDVHAESWQHAIQQVLHINVPIESIYADINYGIDVLLKKYQLSEKESQLAQEYKRDIFAKNIHKTHVNNLLLYMIKTHYPKSCVIASNSSRENIDKIMTYHGIDPNLFLGIYTREDVLVKKPHPEMGELILKDLASRNLSFDNYLMIGDSEVDQIFARKLGIECLLIS